MRKNTGKIILCVIATVILIIGGSYLLKLDREMNARLSRLKKADRIEVELTEVPKGNYSSDTEKYIWMYSYTNDIGKKVTSTTVNRYTKAELEEVGYRMNICVAGNDSAEEPYVLTAKKENYDGAILFYCLSLLPMLFVGWMMYERHLFDIVIQKGDLYYAEFLEAFRDGSYYKVKFAFEVDGKRIVKTTKAAYSLNAVTVFKDNGMIEIRYYKNRVAISQKILGIKM